MHETELWITKLFNEYLAGVGNTLTGIVGIAPQARPWANFVTMQLLVAAIIVVLFAFLKSRLSAFKVPKEYIPVEELPKNAAGKILKRELKKTHPKG